MANNIQKTKKSLAKSRRKARKLAGGQLEAIQSRQNKQLARQARRFDTRTNKLLQGMNKFVQNQRAIGQGEVRAVGRQGRQFAGQASATGGRGSALDYGIVRGRQRQVAREAKTLTGVAKVQRQQGRGVQGAAQGALAGQARTGAAAGRATATVLDVLEAERAMVDERFVAELRAQKQSQKADRRFQLQVMERQAELNEVAAQRDFQRQKTMAEYNYKLADKYGTLPESAGSQRISAISTVLTAAADRVVTLNQTEENRALPLAERQQTISTQIAGEYNLSEPQDVAAIQQLVRSLTTDTTPGPDDVAAEVAAVIRTVPGWSEVGKSQKQDYLTKALEHDYQALRIREAGDKGRRDREGGGGDGGFNPLEWLGDSPTVPNISRLIR